MLIKKDPDLIKSYLEDYSNISGANCESVYLPQSDEEVAQIMRSADKESVPITISGAGTSVTGARLPFGGRVLSTEKLNNIYQIYGIDSGEGEASLGSGVVLEDFLKEVEGKGFFFPPNPTEKSSFIGGNVSTSASGARSFQFGTIRDYLLGIEAVLSNGDKFKISRGEYFFDGDGSVTLPLLSGEKIDLTIPLYSMPSIKNAAGYYAKKKMDLIDLFIGHEGTLAVITKVKVRLLRGLSGLLNCYAFFKSQKDALDFAKTARGMSAKDRNSDSKINAMSLEFFNVGALSLLRRKHPNIPKDSKAALFFEQEVDPKNESSVIDAWARLIEDANGSLDDTWFAMTRKDQEELAKVRHDLPDSVNEYIKHHDITKVGTDIAVPFERLDEMISFYDSSLKDSKMFYVIFGHIGDSHLHVNILPEDSSGLSKAKAIYEKLVKKAIELEGTVSAEHGIGKIKHQYLNMMYKQEGVAQMVKLKKRLDPGCILGLDNIFPKELLKG